METTSLDLYWLPLGAGGQSVRFNGRLFEAVAARRQHRSARDLYHSALELRLPEGFFVVEMGPVPTHAGAQCGVVAEGPVGAHWARRLRIFRHGVRCWRDGAIPDVTEAVESPRRLSGDARTVRRVRDLVPSVPTPVWGRDELGAGEMWNSNSVISWLITRAGLPVDSIALPAAGSAPGWNAGIVVARRRNAEPGREAGSARRKASCDH